ncbi:MAG TPA: energy-coupling factor transporter transmembrane component T [Promineifilum sp.]|nr:energy-coupling factor transporter transmembrane component T [Promineifilum sp.]HRQ12067.1 energy-coupling factor transporter transmembrane component T [Promineifilum sp.]
MTLDVRAWVVWLFAGGLLAILTSNPFYLILLLIISRLVEYACASHIPQQWRLPFWRIAIVILFFSTLFNALTAHFGQTSLFALPAQWPLIGGDITLEAAVFGFLNGLRLITLLSFFLAFNSIVPASQLAGLTPRALHEIGLVLLIAITYIPETIGQYRRIRDAQAIRGYRMRGWRIWHPILIPLLISGLERALNLSETMVARGYGSTTNVSMPARARAAMLAGLLLTLAGALRLVWGGLDGWALIAIGGLAIAGAYLDLSRQVSRTQYYDRRWSLTATWVVNGALIALGILLVSRRSLNYSPYPDLTAPPFDTWIGAAILGLAVPAIIILFRKPAIEVPA